MAAVLAQNGLGTSAAQALPAFAITEFEYEEIVEEPGTYFLQTLVYHNPPRPPAWFLSSQVTHWQVVRPYEYCKLEHLVPAAAVIKSPSLTTPPRVRLRTKVVWGGVTGSGAFSRAGLWMQIETATGAEIINADYMNSRPLMGNTIGYTRTVIRPDHRNQDLDLEYGVERSVVLEVPRLDAKIRLGLFLRGGGRAWWG